MLDSPESDPPTADTKHSVDSEERDDEVSDDGGDDYESSGERRKLHVDGGCCISSPGLPPSPRSRTILY